jgi:hypothetical protein
MEEKMELIERYLHEIGKYLPHKNREDILAEIKSYLEDTLDERTGGKPTEDAVVALLKETGSPQKMAASYAPQGQYVVGPALFPLWRMVTGIALAATIGAQLLAWGIGLWAGNGDIHAVELVSGLITSIPMTIGSVTIVFMILQSAGVQPHLEEKWDPRNLPEIKSGDDIKRGDLIAGIVFGILILAVFAVMPDKVGVYNFNSGKFFANPVILQYLPLIFLSMGVNIGLDIYLLWRGRWEVASRAFQIGADLFSIVVLVLLYKGHSAWLTAHGYIGFFGDISRLVADINTSYQLFGMECFQIAFGVALIVTVSVLISRFVKMIIRSLRAGRAAEFSAK